MVFHRAKTKISDRGVIIQDQKLTQINETKFLGVIIDDKFNWISHITYIKNKISKSIGILYRTRQFLNKDTLRNLYFTFVYPYLIYSVEV